jgi:hypothetical protein
MAKDFPNCACSGCNTHFHASGNQLLLVLTGGADCPKCGKKDGIDMLVAHKPKVRTRK